MSHNLSPPSSLVSLNVLPDRFRYLFSFSTLNLVQSKSFPCVYNTEHNFVLSAPTGSGKTAIFELAICRAVSQLPAGSVKVVYVAPTKSLCTERLRDWQAKFRTLDLVCTEFTGDSDPATSRHIRGTDIIITTPEKWDSVTRRWKENRELMQSIKLFLIDEVHILKESRGATLEAVVSRMRSIGSRVRFIALSATIPNVEDIAEWLRIDNYSSHPARYEVFNDSFRPVPLQKFVYGVTSQGSEYVIDATCDGKLFDIIKQHGARRLVLIFCMTRKITARTAATLAKDWAAARPQDRPWPAPERTSKLSDSKLNGLFSCGVAYHHAGVTLQDRNTLEASFRRGELFVMCCTSTLAVGVNLPCYLVIIKNTVTWKDDGLKEYSQMEITQMIGRAGRPQYDDRAVAVILTRQEKVTKYKRVVSVDEVIESCLHKNLLEHLNSEISLGMIRDSTTAQSWIQGTFLAVRVAKNSGYYTSRDQALAPRVATEMIEGKCLVDIQSLRETNLIQGDETFTATEFGRTMARHYVKFKTMKCILTLPEDPDVSHILHVLASAEELREVRWKSGEKKFYRLLNAMPEIRYPIRVNLATTEHKVFLLVQATLADVDVPSSSEFEYCRRQYEMDGKLAFTAMGRLIRCIVDCQIHLKSGRGTRSALEMTRSLAAKVWDDSPLQMRQIHGLGPVAVRKLIGVGILSLEELEATEPHRINVLMNRNTGFGESLRNKLRELPKLSICLRVLEKRYRVRSSPMVRFSVDIGFLNDTVPETFNRKPIFVCLVAERSDGLLIDFNRFSADTAAKNPVHLSVEILEPTQEIVCSVMCDEIAGTLRSAVLDPKCPPSFFDSDFSGRAECGVSQTAASEIFTPNKTFVRPSGGDDGHYVTTPEVGITCHTTSMTMAVVGEIDSTNGGRPKRPRDLPEAEIAQKQPPPPDLVQTHQDQRRACIAPKFPDPRSSSNVSNRSTSNRMYRPQAKKICSREVSSSSLGTLRPTTDNNAKGLAKAFPKCGVLLHGDSSSDTDIDDPYSSSHYDGSCSRFDPPAQQHYKEIGLDTSSRHFPKALSLHKQVAQDDDAPGVLFTAAEEPPLARETKFPSTQLTYSGGPGLQNPWYKDTTGRKIENFDAELLREFESCIEILEDP